MAEEQKPTEVPQETVAAPTEQVAAPTAEPTTTEETPAAPAPAVESSEAPKTTEATPAVEEPAKKDGAPIEHGHLDYKVSNFPKNLLYSKKYFWFGSDPVETKKLQAHVKNDAHHILSWASETGKGLFFFSDNHDKSSPQGVIPLADASEPATEGNNKFNFNHKGSKYTFKVPNAADRDAWVSQLKAKIAEAKEAAGSITESETYKKTMAGLKPTPAAAPVKKEEKTEDKPVEAAAAGTAAGAAIAEPAATETPVAPAEESKKDVKPEESKRRSDSRKRQSIFGSLFPKKQGAEEKKAETAAPAEAAAATEAPAVAAPTETTANEAVPADEPVSTEAPAAVTSDVPPEPKGEESKPIKDNIKPPTGKRNSVFGNFKFGGNKKSAAPETETPAAAPAAPAKDTPAADPAPVADSAPVIPAVESTEPLSAEVHSPATVPVENVEVKPATNGVDSKKEMKSEKRKASLPFNFGGKKDKTPATEESTTEKTKAAASSAFSKLRQTIKGKNKQTDAPTEKEEKSEAAAAEEPAAESSKPAEAAAEEAPKTEEPAAPAAAPAEETPAEQPIATTTPAVAATA